MEFKTLHMSLEDSLKWLGEVMAEIGPSNLQKNEKWSIFDTKQANAIIDYLKISLFQHYKLYEFLFYSTREEIVIGTEQMIETVKPSGGLFPNPLEEGISFDIYSAFIEPPPTLDTEMKVCFLLCLNSPSLSIVFPMAERKGSNYFSIFSHSDFSQLNVRICFAIDSQVGQSRVAQQF
ncbi:ciliary associated calcium binding coiled-coil 1 [Phyllostomus discolor]|uniref:Ciliary associated calcium binding coiled-coil 1 n=1 Tax=Phyllostomus discolor TaxID=89673 RepID=A0A834AAM4_9CHIR|nr:ciliary associated calcium binding coiled-coil 1 [Phyllostomus discolor]